MDLRSFYKFICNKTKTRINIDILEKYLIIINLKLLIFKIILIFFQIK
jgi:hypothetical protein